MKKINRFTILTSLLLLLVMSCKNQKQSSNDAEHVGPTKITVQSLLKEMVSREAIAQLPSPAYKNLQASSYDRLTVSRDEGWHANGDRSHFVRVEEKEDGRHEHVMMDVKGPGAIVRWWSVTSSVPLLDGRLKIYIDNDSVPTFSGRIEDLIGGDFFAPSPLSMALAEVSPKEQRGRNLYLPIPFEKSIKVSYEATDGRKLIKGEPAWPNDGVFYNINYRLYDSTVEVESLTPETLAAAKELIESTGKELMTAEVAGSTTVKTLVGTIKPEETKTLEITAPTDTGGALDRIAVKIKAENLPQALRSTILEISFDGERTVWVPVGDFFGTGYQIRKSKSWYGSVEENGTLLSQWLMPFAEKSTITLYNLGEQKVTVEVGEISVTDWEWDERSMHFGAAWQQYTNMNSKPDHDVNYVTLKGKGVYVGDALTLFDISPKWWGEGDEKIFVDDDTFPVHFGTGSEDYYGYAWCLGAPFSTPFVMQPDGSGNLTVGYTINARYRLLDGIPFSKKFHFDMEVQHWGESRLNYAPTVFWYARPGVESNIQPALDAAKHKVALTPEDV